ncbi:MAG: hypothetical protein ACKV22_00155 [Bryobacteraceae bacterium]
MNAAWGAGSPWIEARKNGQQVDEIFARTNRMLHRWLSFAEPKTLLLPDRVPGVLFGRLDADPIYTPHNSGADNYPYLIATAFFTEPDLIEGRLLEMLRNEIRYTNVGTGAIPGNLNLRTYALGPPSFFGAGEYSKDGAVPVTELMGRGPWYYRMADMMEDFRVRAPVRTRFGNLPDNGAELNGDVLQALARLIPMTGDNRLLRWAEQIGDAYVEEILPKSGYLPPLRWSWETGSGDETIRLGDHGNETIVGLVLTLALEAERGLPRGESWRPVLRKTLDRVLESANSDGFFYRVVRASDLKPVNPSLTDCWGYIYGSIYAYYQVTGEEKYRDAVRRVLTNLAKYRDYDWTRPVNTVDDLADSIEGAIYLAAYEPVPEALAWIEHSVPKMFPYQKEDGAIERWYGDGNWNRTLLLYALMKTQGCFLDRWRPGVELGSVREGDVLHVSVRAAQPWSGKVRFDYARHKRIVNYRKNYCRLNQWPEWFTVDENTLYEIRNPEGGGVDLRLGSELKQGYPLTIAGGATARRTIQPAR